MFSRLDKLVVKSFLGPFVVTFAISVFALMMQVLWLYLDDIAGKGLGFFTVVELMTYKCVGLVPLAMPLALLISSVMVLGGMAEHYELSSIKSAGTSLLRVMRPLVVFGAIGSMISFACADYIIPAANLQFGSRMYDIQKKKPTLNMEPGMFNEDFNQFAIRLGGRDDDGRHISDVLIYDHTKASTGDLGQITAATGEMYTENDGAVFVMKLYDGVQYSERKAGGKNRSALPFVRTAFESYTKVFDLSQFLMGSTAPELFKANRSMLATWQLDIAIDSIDTDIKIRKQTVSNQLTSYLPLVKRDTNIYKAEFAPKFKDPGRPSDTVNISSSIRDVVDKKEKTTVPKAESITGKGPTKKATRPSRPIKTTTPSGITRIDNTPKKKQMTVTETDLARKEVTMGIQLKRVDARNKALNHIVVRATNKWNGVRSVMDSLDKAALTRVLNRARSATRSISSQAQSAQRILPGVMESRVKHIYDLHMKYSMSLVCIIFIFIGAPMGAIVRKGGFGYPILVSIFFFVIFIILTIFCRKLAESFVVNGTMAGWLPCIILFPISLYITRTAMNDGKLVSLDAPKRGISIIMKAFKHFRKRMTS